MLVHDPRGSIGMIFGMALAPMTIFTGASIDYARAVRTRNVMQAALDLAILAAAQKTSSLNDSEFTTQVNAIYAANGGMDVHADTISVSVTRTNEQVTGQVTASSPNTLMQIVGSPASRWPSHEGDARTGDMEVVLVLDNTGSMRYMGALKTGATDLANALFDKAGTATLKVAVVPYVGAATSERRPADGLDGHQCNRSTTAWRFAATRCQEAGCVRGPDPGGGGGGAAPARALVAPTARTPPTRSWASMARASRRHARHSRHLDRAGQPDEATRLFDHHHWTACS